MANTKEAHLTSLLNLFVMSQECRIVKCHKIRRPKEFLHSRSYEQCVMCVNSAVVHKNKGVPKQIIIITVRSNLRNLKYCLVCLLACLFCFCFPRHSEQSNHFVVITFPHSQCPELLDSIDDDSMLIDTQNSCLFW